MFLRRCAWHRRYHGHVKYLGVSSWRGWNVTFSDGMCTDCAARARAEWSLPAAAAAKAMALPRPRRLLRPDFALAAGVLLLTIGVAFGVLIGPPPRTVSHPIEPATSVASQGVSDGIGGGPSSSGSSSVGPRVEHGASTGSDGAGRAVQDAVADADRGRGRPVRIARASAKRPVRATTYRADAIEFVSAPEPPVGDAGRAVAGEEISPLAGIAIQAP